MNIEKVDILIVDDRPENLYALEVVLNSPSYNLIKASSGTEALKYLLDNDCALILMDVQMPGMDGFETATYIKQSPRSANIPIIFITAISKDERFVHKGYKTGAVDYIFKPFEAEILKSKVDVFVELHRSKEEIKRQAELLHESDTKERERALAQLELRSLRRDQAAQKKYRDLVDGINHGIIWAADYNSLNLSFVSPAAERLLDYPAESWFNEINFLLNHIHDDDRKLFLSAVQNVKEGQDLGFEHRIRKVDGTYKWFHTGIRLAQKSENEEYEIRGLSIDITPMKEAETALKQSEERALFMAEASLLLSESLDYQITLSKLGELTIPRFADWYCVDVLSDDQALHSISMAHLDSKKVKFDHNENHFDKTAKFGISKVIQNGKSELYTHVSNEDLSGLCCDKESTNFLNQLGPKSAIVAPLQTRGKKLGTITFISSASKQRYSSSDLSMLDGIALRAAIAIDNATLYKQAQDAVRARDEFLSVASHELKTPLTPLKLHTQSMMRSLQRGTFSEIFPGKLKKIIETSDKQINRLSQLIDDLLDISRINIGQLNLNLQQFNLSELIKDLADRFTEELEIAKCPLELKLSPEVVGYWDHFRMEQVITNLLTNAIKYGAGKPIVIYLEKNNDSAKLIVKDNGIGIEKKDQARIFERFERAVSPYNFRGLGLGLFIVKELVSLHFGEIHVDSTPGVGSSFIVELPTNLAEKNAGFHIDNRSQEEKPQVAL